MSARTERVVEISKEWMDKIFRAKNDDYGESYVLTGQTIHLWLPEGFTIDSEAKAVFIGLLTRMLDKLIRTTHLVFRGSVEKVADEKIYQTMGDLGVYGFMTSEYLSPENNKESAVKNAF